MRTQSVFPHVVVPAGPFLGLRHWTRWMSEITSICLHDCLAFIALGEVLLLQALPLLCQENQYLILRSGRCTLY